jgi:hypothetical protein
MRGMTHGLLGFAAFLTVIAAVLVPLGIAAAFALAFTAVVVVQGIELRSALQQHRPEPAAEMLLPEASD